ncbi:hypothetical protein MIMGU_mgv1a020200mg, partial [Erythranthe guttata]
MAAKKLLDIQPSELKFNYKLMNDQVSSSIRLSNRTEQYVTFKVETSNPMKYCVSPCMGIVLPESDFDVRVRMKAQSEIPSDRQCEDKFLIQSIVVTPSMTTRNVTPKMFDEKERCGEESKLGIVYTFPLLISDPQSSSSAISRAHSSSK